MTIATQINIIFYCFMFCMKWFILKHTYICFALPYIWSEIFLLFLDAFLYFIQYT